MTQTNSQLEPPKQFDPMDQFDIDDEFNDPLSEDQDDTNAPLQDDEL